MPELEFTGERVVPGQVEADLWNEHYARYLFAAPWAAGKRVADLGCGAGYGTALLAETAASAVGVDISSDAVQYAHAHYARPNLQYRAAPATSTGLEAAAFDLITCFELIEHLADWPRLLDEARRLLAPGGLFVVSTPNKNYYAEARVDAGANPYHEHEFEYDEFATALGQAFPHVALWLQNHTGATVIQPVAPAPDAALRYEFAGPSPAAAHFYIALCSTAPTPAAPTFVHVPPTANMLREREMHIARLEGELATLRARHLEVQAELESSNVWARNLDADLGQARGRVVEVQNELAAQQSAAQSAINALQARFDADVTECNRLLDEANATIEERTAWALSLNAELEVWNQRMARIRASRWYRLGRKLGLRLNLKPGEELGGAGPDKQ